MKTVTLNDKQQLFVIPCGDGYSCLGYDVCENRTIALYNELNKLFHLTGTLGTIPTKGTIEAYNYYNTLVDHVARLHKMSGFRSQSELNPKLIGLEGKKITAIVYGEKETFRVGKSTGFIPCHLMIEQGEDGGMALPTEPERIEIIKVFKR